MTRFSVGTGETMGVCSAPASPGFGGRRAATARTIRPQWLHLRAFGFAAFRLPPPGLAGMKTHLVLFAVLPENRVGACAGGAAGGLPAGGETAVTITEKRRAAREKNAMIIRELRDDETGLLKDLLYEAIFVPKKARAPGRSILEQPEFTAYYEGFGSGPADHCLVAEVDGRAAGAVWARIIEGFGYVEDGTPWLAIALYADYRGRGIGTALMRRMLERLKAQGYRQAVLSVHKANGAVRMYKALGFRTIGEKGREYVMLRRL